MKSNVPDSFAVKENTIVVEGQGNIPDLFYFDKNGVDHNAVYSLSCRPIENLCDAIDYATELEGLNTELVYVKENGSVECQDSICDICDEAVDRFILEDYENRAFFHALMKDGEGKKEFEEKYLVEKNMKLNLALQIEDYPWGAGYDQGE